MPASIDAKRDEARRRALAYAERIAPEEDAHLTAAAEADSDNPPLTDEVWSRMKPKMGRPRGPVEKVPVTIRMDADIVAALKSQGSGWQTRANALLRDAVTGQFLLPEGALAAPAKRSKTKTRRKRLAKAPTPVARKA